MGFLRVLGLRLVLANEGGDVALRKLARDEAADGVDRLRHDRHAVGAHVGDEADRLAADVDALVEALRHLHGLLGREAELAGGVHLQGRGGERRIGVALRRLLLDRGDLETLLLDGRLDGVGARRVLDVELLQRRAGDGVQACGELLALGRLEGRLDRPVLVGLEALDLLLAVADEAQRHRLHAAGRVGARQLAPEHRREREADEIVERAAGEIGIHQRLVDLARMLHRLRHRLLGDGIEGDALDADALEHLLVIEDVEDMPGDRLALAVGVGGEDQLVGAFDRLGDLRHDLLRLAVHLPGHLEVLVGQHRAVLGGQVAHMAEGRQDLVAGAQILVDGLGLGGAFDDDDPHARASASLSFGDLGMGGAVLARMMPMPADGGREDGGSGRACQTEGARTGIKGPPRETVLRIQRLRMTGFTPVPDDAAHLAQRQVARDDLAGSLHRRRAIRNTRTPCCSGQTMRAS